MLARSRWPLEPGFLGDSDASALQVADAFDGLVREQLVAPGMHARQCHHRLAGTHVGDDPCDGFQVEVDLAARDSIEGSVRHVADILEPLRAEQGLGNLPGRYADGGGTGQPDGGRFRQRLVGEHAPATKHARGAGRGHGGKEIAARLHEMHAKSPLLKSGVDL
jgi:hypothetical protein